MRVLFFAMLLSVVQTAGPPIPATQTPQNSKAQSSKREKAINQSPSSQDVTKKAVEEHRPVNNPAPNAEQVIRVVELPPVSVTRDWMDKTSWFFSLVLVIVGIGGVCAALKTLSAIKQQKETMDRTLQVDQRAWMGIENIKIRQNLAPDSDFIVEVESKNTGKTPALRATFSIKLQALLAGEQLDRTFGESSGHGTVMPDSRQFHSIGGNHPVSAATFEQVHNGVRTMYLHGRIEYQDIFRKPHWTNWCFRLVGERLFEAHNEYNDTDDSQQAAV